MEGKHARRRAKKRKDVKSQSIGDLFTKLATAQFDQSSTQEAQEKTMKAICKRLALRETVVGNTVFTFDKDGICELKPNGRGGAYADFKVLLSMNGIKEYKEEPAEEPKKEAAVAPKVEAEAAPAPDPEPDPEPEPAPEPVEAMAEEKEPEPEVAAKESSADEPTKKRGWRRVKKEND